MISGLFNRYLGMLKLETLPVISADEILIMLPRTIPVTPNKPDGGLVFKAGDDRYNTTSVQSMQSFLKTWLVKYVVWSKKFDCDNFADIFMGYAKLTNPSQAVGKIWVIQPGNLRHALNFFVFYENKAYQWAYIEPQTAEVMRLTDSSVLNWRPYFVNL